MDHAPEMNKKSRSTGLFPVQRLCSHLSLSHSIINPKKTIMNAEL